jgi:hypothetical protein
MQLGYVNVILLTRVASPTPILAKDAMVVYPGIARTAFYGAVIQLEIRRYFDVFFVHF